ncbi:hypothetical protein CKO28_19445 [Rhodovibrio sodomensis]|uniref:Uncharacterized protein n=1 Tax=Rhodovibrio sodomensis TaxID=1088 RepID=A0ABS1DIB8_9PROT|nr:hypothetical protein [Rhodovibrio sodomensis]MBK1670212.1 hypothetical protein [Rhodovibrio sodomensis]
MDEDQERQASAEIEVTDEMLKAGVEAVSIYRDDAMAETLASMVYQAMEEVRRRFEQKDKNQG